MSMDRLRAPGIELLLRSSLMVGEQLHEKGADGARRAKRWLEATTRANVQWVNPQPVAMKKLSFVWHDGSSFSFDLGGLLRGDDVEGQEFLAEVKNYKDQSDQPDLYKEFLAKCYRAYTERPDRCDNFMWITWAPFNATIWSQLRDVDRVRKAVAEHSGRVLGSDVGWEDVPEGTSSEVAERVWIIVLSKAEEKWLSLSPEHRAVVEAHIVNQQAGAV